MPSWNWEWILSKKFPSIKWKKLPAGYCPGGYCLGDYPRIMASYKATEPRWGWRDVAHWLQASGGLFTGSLIVWHRAERSRCTLLQAPKGWKRRRLPTCVKFKRIDPLRFYPTVSDNCTSIVLDFKLFLSLLFYVCCIPSNNATLLLVTF